MPATAQVVTPCKTVCCAAAASVVENVPRQSPVTVCFVESDDSSGLKLLALRLRSFSLEVVERYA